MKKRLFLTKMIVLVSLLANATIVDLTTGMGAAGDDDPIWEVDTPSPGGFGPVTISTGVLEDPSGHMFSNAYCHDECGQWISPYVNASFNIIKTGVESGYFTYKREFILDNCISPQALLNFDFMAADNEIVGLLINGTPYPLPGMITHLTCDVTMTDVVIDVMPGLNTVEVIVDNYSSYTALQLCGEIIVFDDLTPLDDLHCCLAPIGQVLSWSPAPGAIEYEVEITWNDPHCCGDVGEVSIETINVTENILIIPSSTDCFSWRVKAIFPECESEFSLFNCSCGDYCIPPSALGCKYTIDGDIYLDWEDIPFATGYQVEVVFGDPACCSFATVLGAIYPVMTSSLLIDFNDVCYSWRVRTVCEDGSFSEWSTRKCNCPSLSENTEISNRDNANTEIVEFSVMPNPADNLIYVRSNCDSKNQAQLKMHDVNGKVVYEAIILENQHDIRVDQLLEGVYTLSISKDNTLTTKQVVIKR